MSILDDVISRCENVTSLAQGGQKKVYSAVHPVFGSVVIKHGEYRFATTLERITREVELLRELTSPFYPRHFAFLIEPIRREFLIIEERLDAVALSTVMDRFTTDPEITTLLKQVLCALDVIWKRKVVHRDIKPANILITPTGEPRIIDLGIARFLDDASLTASIAAMGPATPIYASPEQLQNRKALIGVRTDFFLLGLLTLELIHGFHPFDPTHVGGSGSLIDNLLAGHYMPPAAGRDAMLKQFVEGALRPEPYKRFRTVDAVMRHFSMDRERC